jgi:hypothetical protein
MGVVAMGHTMRTGTDVLDLGGRETWMRRGILQAD